MAIIRFFLSMKTAFGFFLVSLVIFFAGSLSLPAHLAFFSGIDDAPLFRWLSESSNVRITWWIYALILVLALLAISTIFCTAEALLKRISGRNLLAQLSPQIMHIGILFILLGHLITASTGFKTDLVIKEGEKVPVTAAGERAIFVRNIQAVTDANGYFTDWQAALQWIEDGKRSDEKVLRPARPLYFGPFGLYIKSVMLEPERSVLLRVSRDPGALWALMGGLLLSLGGAAFVAGKLKR